MENCSDQGLLILELEGERDKMDELARVGFMVHNDIDDYIHSHEAIGLVFLNNDLPQDIIVVDQQR